MSDYDSPWKEALDRYLEAFLAFFFPEAHAGIDWTRRYESLDKELQQVTPDAYLGRRIADKLLKVWRQGGQEEWILVHVEVQGTPAEDFAQRMYVYNYRLFDHYNRQVASLAVLGDDRVAWRPDRFGYALWGCEVGIRFPVVKLLDYAADEAMLEQSRNPFAVLVLAHLKTRQTQHDPLQRRMWKGRLVRGLYERGWSAEDVRQLFRFIDWMMDLPAELEREFRSEVASYEQEKHMPYVTSVERLAREEGRAEGRAEGQAMGRAEGLLRGIELGLKLKFGPTGLELLPAIRQQARIEVLEALYEALESAASLDDLRALLEPGCA